MKLLTLEDFSVRLAISPGEIPELLETASYALAQLGVIDASVNPTLKAFAKAVERVGLEHDLDVTTLQKNVQTYGKELRKAIHGVGKYILTEGNILSKSGSQKTAGIFSAIKSLLRGPVHPEAYKALKALKKADPTWLFAQRLETLAYEADPGDPEEANELMVAISTIYQLYDFGATSFPKLALASFAIPRELDRLLKQAKKG
jgi:hypothetical protein